MGTMNQPVPGLTVLAAVQPGYMGYRDDKTRGLYTPHPCLQPVSPVCPYPVYIPRHAPLLSGGRGRGGCLRPVPAQDAVIHQAFYGRPAPLVLGTRRRPLPPPSLHVLIYVPAYRRGPPATKTGGIFSHRSRRHHWRRGEGGQRGGGAYVCMQAVLHRIGQNRDQNSCVRKQLSTTLTYFIISSYIFLILSHQ